MKKILVLTLLTLSLKTFAEDLACSVNLNLQNVSDVEISVQAKEKAVFAEFENFKFFVSNKGDSKFEIEVFNANEESRSYASGNILNAKDEVTWTLWTRDYLIDASCKLAK